MSNEELAVQAKAGSRDALAQLWERTGACLLRCFAGYHRKRARE